MPSSLTLAAPQRRLAWLQPAVVVAILLVAYIALVVFQNGLNPLALADIGDGFANGRPIDKVEGYDGQFSYWLAMNPKPGRGRHAL